MADYTYFHFDVVQFSDVLALYQGQHEDTMILKGYQTWLGVFGNRAHSFYMSQFQRHREQVHREFCREYDVPLSAVPNSYEFEWAWAEFCERTGLSEHERVMDSAVDSNQSYYDSYYPDRPLWIDSHDVLVKLRKRLTGEYEVWPEDLHLGIWELWFNQHTMTTDENQRKLRRLPYHDYLKSMYWKRKRAAMLLMHRLRCQSTVCYGFDSYFGDEHELHVHHLHYKNRGNERMDDLRLLCTRCHDRVHGGDTNIIGKYQFDLAV